MPRTFAALVISLSLLITAPGCGGGSAPTNIAEEAVSAASTDSVASPDVAMAIAAVEDALAGSPIWKGAKLSGVVHKSDEVCVDYTPRKDVRADLSIGTNHVIVSWPDLVVSEDVSPGACPKDAAAEQTARAAEADAVQRKLRVVLKSTGAMADQLNVLVRNGQASEATARRLDTLYTQARKVGDNYLTATGEMSKASNLLISAIAEARNAARAGDTQKLRRVQKDIVDVRSAILKETP